MKRAGRLEWRSVGCGELFLCAFPHSRHGKFYTVELLADGARRRVLSTHVDISRARAFFRGWNR